MPDVYITRTSSYLPNSVVTNDEIEDYLGFINDKESKPKALVLRSNKIKERYYAIDKQGNATHTNAELTSLAVKKLFDNTSNKIKEIDLLSCGTSSPDQMMPSHGVMVHGWLPEMESIEVTSPSGNCCSGMHALKYAFMSLRLGDKNKAVCTGSERLSKIMRAEHFEAEVQELIKLGENPYLAFEKDFLRWMLSDGAGAFLLESKANENDISLRIDWMEAISFANKEEVCMYMGADKLDSGELKSYMEFTPTEASEKSIFSIKQDTKLLGEKIVELSFLKIPEIFKKHNISSESFDYFLVHMSSYFFESKIAQHWDELDMHIPKEKWFTNLATKGNVGAGSIYLMVDELFKSGKLRKGEKLLLVVPESSRFSYAYCHLTVC